MRPALAALILSACWRTRYVDKPIVHVEWRNHWAACLVLAPPKPPLPSVPPDSSLMSMQDWEDIERAKWADYGHEADRWINLYAWPRCQFDEKKQEFKKEP